MQSDSRFPNPDKPHLLRVTRLEDAGLDSDRDADGSHTSRDGSQQRDDSQLQDEPQLQDEEWLGEDSLAELASQLSSDAGFLADRYPASDHRAVALESSGRNDDSAAWLDRKMAGSSLPPNAQRKRRRLTHQLISAASLATVVLAVVTITYSMLSPNESSRTTSSRHGVQHESMNRGEFGDQHSIPSTGQPGAGEALAEIDSPLPADSNELVTTDHESVLVPASTDPNLVTTEVSHHVRPMIYYASQAELEGLIDAADRSPTNKIRIGF